LLETGKTTLKAGNQLFLMSLMPKYIASFFTESQTIVQKMEPLTFELEEKEHEVELLGKTVKLGMLNLIVRGHFAGTPEEFTDLVTSHDFSEPLPLYLKDVEITYCLPTS
jgi:hypothetical protein